MVQRGQWCARHRLEPPDAARDRDHENGEEQHHAADSPVERQGQDAPAQQDRAGQEQPEPRPTVGPDRTVRSLLPVRSATLRCAGHEAANSHFEPARRNGDPGPGLTGPPSPPMRTPSSFHPARHTSSWASVRNTTESASSGSRNA
ncbi:Uncharacterised protein [Mycobacteroides abscessus subsp. abscessus]|nr:Uncharacterised protein [Mycobacteroides abscessus subsp. abscessus]